jgi:outer membrane protein W
LGISGTETIGDIDIMPLLLGANFHVLRKEKVGIYLGAQIGYVAYGDLAIKDKGPDESDISMKDGFAYGLLAGVDAPFGDSKWMFNGSVAWLSTDADFDEPGSPSDGIAIDPIVVRIGVGRRF